MDQLDISSDAALVALVVAALEEDIGTGDVTTNSLVAPDIIAKAEIIARGDYVVAGVTVGAAVFEQVDSNIVYTVVNKDGHRVVAGDRLATIEGPACGILTGERVALNFMQRMTGIATLTSKFVHRAGHNDTAILDTRKTTPGLRVLEKYAVHCGGGQNHRMGLYDQVLIKDNHRRLWADSHHGGLKAAVAAARAKHPGIPVEVEVESEAELEDVLRATPDWVLLDNMPPAQLKRCVAICAGRCKLEASGGITLETVDAVAHSGVDAISLGCLTHSAPAADLSLELA